METDSGSKSAILFSQRLLRCYAQKRKMIYMRLITNFIAGSLLTGILAFAPATSFARGGGGGGGGHFGGGGGGHFGGLHDGRGAGAWHHDGGWAHHPYSGRYARVLRSIRLDESRQFLMLFKRQYTSPGARVLGLTGCSAGDGISLTQRSRTDWLCSRIQAPRHHHALRSSGGGYGAGAFRTLSSQAQA